MLDALGKPAVLKTIVPDRPGHDRRYLLDSSKLRAELGWAPEVDFDAGVRETVAVVRGPPRVVGAAPGSGADRRGCVGEPGTT